MLFIFSASCCFVIKAQTVGLWHGVKCFFTSMWHVFVSRLVQIFLNIGFFMAIGFLTGVMTVSFALPIDL